MPFISFSRTLSTIIVKVMSVQPFFSNFKGKLFILSIVSIMLVVYFYSYALSDFSTLNLLQVISQMGVEF